MGCRLHLSFTSFLFGKKYKASQAVHYELRLTLHKRLHDTSTLDKFGKGFMTLGASGVPDSGWAHAARRSSATLGASGASARL